VAQALAGRFPALAWETTHVGGDRFAANLVILPSGGYYGRLDPEDAVRVAESALRGRIDLDRLPRHGGSSRGGAGGRMPAAACARRGGGLGGALPRLRLRAARETGLFVHAYGPASRSAAWACGS